MTDEQIKLVNILDECFQHVEHAAVPYLYTTMEVFAKLQSIYPSGTYKPEDVYEVLSYKQFETMNSTDSKLYWLIQERQR